LSCNPADGTGNRKQHKNQHYPVEESPFPHCPDNTDVRKDKCEINGNKHPADKTQYRYPQKIQVGVTYEIKRYPGNNEQHIIGYGSHYMAGSLLAKREKTGQQEQKSDAQGDYPIYEEKIKGQVHRLDFKTDSPEVEFKI
jgi:hypothetical protein